MLEFKKVSKVYRREKGINLRARYAFQDDELIALHDISFTIAAGAAVGVVGKSAAGKSTLVKLASGLEQPASGEILVGKQEKQLASAPGESQNGPLSRKPITLKERAGILQVVWQDGIGSLNPRMKVDDILAEPLRIHHRKAAKDKIAQLLEEVSLPAGVGGRYPQQLSGGEAQRVAIARALSLDPDLLICDEPASALDIQTKVKICRLINSLRQSRKMALLLIAHDLPMIRKLTDALIVMDGGRIVESGQTEKVLKSPAHPATRSIIEAEPVLTGRVG